MSAFTDTLKAIAPTIASALLGPEGPILSLAVTTIGNILGISAPTQASIKTAIENAQITPEQQVALKTADDSLKVQLAQIAAETKRIGVEADVSDIKIINETMQTEDRTRVFSWRDAWGYTGAAMFAFVCVLAGVIVVDAVFCGQPQLIAQVPVVVDAFLGLFGICCTVLGVNTIQGMIQDHHAGVVARLNAGESRTVTTPVP